MLTFFVKDNKVNSLSEIILTSSKQCNGTCGAEKRNFT